MKRTLGDPVQAEARAPFRDAHLKVAQGYFDRGELVMAGALDEPSDGAVLIFKGDSPQVAENFANSDPYVLNNVVKEWNVRPWIVGFGGK